MIGCEQATANAKAQREKKGRKEFFVSFPLRPFFSFLCAFALAVAFERGEPA
jgi:hypothetical protein